MKQKKHMLKTQQFFNGNKYSKIKLTNNNQRMKKENETNTNEINRHVELYKNVPG